MINPERTYENKEQLFATIAHTVRKTCTGGFVTRKQIEEITGGAISHRTVANQDSLGEGPANKFTVGRKACYPIDDFLDWLEPKISMPMKNAS